MVGATGSSQTPKASTSKFVFNASSGNLTVSGSITTDSAFVENGQTVAANYSITSGHNAISAGPITVNSGVTVTIPSGSTWVIA